MTQLLAVDLGGTHARFALAEVADGRVTSLNEPVTLHTADHASFRLAWEAFAAAVGRPLPRAAAIATAGPVSGEVIKLTNNPWVIRPSLIAEKLGVDAYVVVNDFGAVGHAVAQAGPRDLQHLCGPDEPLPADGIIGIVGPGTGLGVAHLLRFDGGYRVTETEGGHTDFAPLEAIDDAILAHLRAGHRRVSAERVVSGSGLATIHDVLAMIEGRPFSKNDDRTLWTAALEGSDSLASAALDRFCMSLGSVAGDLALAQGAKAVIIAGGLGHRLAAHLPRSGFRQRFTAKGRFERLMAAMPVKIISHPQPGLFGAAAAFAQEHSR